MKTKQGYTMLMDLHTHTVYSRLGFIKHASGTILDNVRAAHQAGLKELAITDHGPSGFFGMRLRYIPRMRREIEEAMGQFPDVKVSLGIEANITTCNNGLDIKSTDYDKFDFINAGFHFGVPGSKMILNKLYSYGLLPRGLTECLRKSNTDMAVNTIMNNPIRIFTHPGDKGPFDIDRLARACEQSGVLMELNAKHKHMTVEEIRISSRYNVKYIISSDAHRPERVGDFSKSLSKALEAGLEIERIVNIKRT